MVQGTPETGVKSATEHDERAWRRALRSEPCAATTTDPHAQELKRADRCARAVAHSDSHARWRDKDSRSLKALRRAVLRRPQGA
jgi:hypothetical protein